MTLEPTRVGLCAEYCGASHAFMAFSVVVPEPAELRRWVAAQASPALAPADATAEHGQAVFLASGCGACRAVRGTVAKGSVGPDLTHVDSRQTLGAGRLPNDVGALHHWLGRPDHLKPGVTMPRFDMLPEDHLRALATCLRGLQ